MRSRTTSTWVKIPQPGHKARWPSWWRGGQFDSGGWPRLPCSSMEHLDHVLPAFDTNGLFSPASPGLPDKMARGPRAC